MRNDLLDTQRITSNQDTEIHAHNTAEHHVRSDTALNRIHISHICLEKDYLNRLNAYCGKTNLCPRLRKIFILVIIDWNDVM